MGCAGRLVAVQWYSSEGELAFLSVGDGPIGVIANGVSPLGVVSIGAAPRGIVSVGPLGAGIFVVAGLPLGLVCAGMGVVTPGWGSGSSALPAAASAR